MAATASVDEWMAFCLRVKDVGYFLMSQCGFDGSEKGIADPRVMATCVLARTVSNLLAVRALIVEGHIVEARAITRCCYENSFWVQGLVDGGDDFVREMRRDEAASFRSRMEFIFKNAKTALPAEADEKLRQRLRRDKNLDPKPLTPREASERGPLGRGYLIYSQLSADAAHPSLSALMRHLTKSVEDDHTVYTVEAVPTLRQGEAEKTLEWACGATVAVIVGVNQLYSGTQAGLDIRSLADEQVKLAGYE